MSHIVTFIMTVVFVRTVKKVVVVRPIVVVFRYLAVNKDFHVMKRSSSG